MVIRDVLLYGSKHWALRKRQEQIWNIVEMKPLRWMLDITRMNHVWNEQSRGSVKVSSIIEKLRKSKLVWFGCVKRGAEEYIRNWVL